ncbi:hypothetical protein PV721_04920 [Streptomyces sp. MB09-01]|uniref:hypothetical protein n=1 Tax=Streptomyces sp. MB09-01 TaxID=3028666 RepID=UPI0029B18071|nr:hypothetical protein [Streptomyces sp. MB09-01]MDX3533716.1 hypothetical protein [Streptomyces sp. MB09-01]
MPIDPYAALNAMLRAEVTRFTPPVRQTEPAEPPKAQAVSVAVADESESEPQQKAADSAG